jgi:hypothetical protein
MHFMDKMKIPIVYTSPYSPQICPTEMVFSMLKRGDMNPENKKSSKK